MARELSYAGRYRKGRTFEEDCSNLLAAVGWRVLRAAGSKGLMKADLVAVHPAGVVAFVQCKTNGAISKEEWDTLYETASMISDGLAIIAYKPSRGVIRFDLITGERIAYKPGLNRTEFDINVPQISQGRYFPSDPCRRHGTRTWAGTAELDSPARSGDDKSSDQGR